MCDYGSEHAIRAQNAILRPIRISDCGGARTTRRLAPPVSRPRSVSPQRLNKSDTGNNGQETELPGHRGR
jgi:hypothetical protein